MAVTCGCERNTFGTIEKLCADHSFAEQRRCHGLIRRAEELEAALRGIIDQAERADDPEHMTLGLVSNIAKQALSKGR